MPPLRQWALLVLVRPFERFFRLEASGGLVLLGAAVVALAWANSRFGDAYEAIWSTRVTVAFGPFGLSKALLLWVNDGLMALFFLLVGLEIKREVMKGELSSPRAAALPIAAALGGMLVPAVLYLLVNPSGVEAAGWGIPMATDIAFALGALALLARRVPTSMRIFLAAAAIVDDIGAVLVIAIAYTPSLAFGPLGVAAAVVAALVALNVGGVRRGWPYAVLGVVLWVAVLLSGVHATVAGVVLALTIPAGPRPDAQDLVDRARDALSAIPRREALAGAPAVVARRAAEDRETALLAMEDAVEAAGAPLSRIEHGLTPWVTFGVIPIFALANAGVRIEGDFLAAVSQPVSLGVIVGLVLGKQIGMTLFPLIAVRAGLASLPEGATWRHVYGVAWLGGIGFTMSIFIAGLALPSDLVPTAKLGILTASALAAAGGFLILGTAPRAHREPPPTR